MERERRRIDYIKYIKSWGDNIEEPLWATSGRALEDRATRSERLSIRFNIEYSGEYNDSWNLLYIYDDCLIN